MINYVPIQKWKLYEKEVEFTYKTYRKVNTGRWKSI